MPCFFSVDPGFFFFFLSFEFSRTELPDKQIKEDHDATCGRFVILEI